MTPPTCPYCHKPVNRVFTDSWDAVAAHEKQCRHNPENHACETCLHGEKLEIKQNTQPPPERYLWCEHAGRVGKLRYCGTWEAQP